MKAILLKLVNWCIERLGGHTAKDYDNLAYSYNQAATQNTELSNQVEELRKMVKHFTPTQSPEVITNPTTTSTFKDQRMPKWMLDQAKEARDACEALIGDVRGDGYNESHVMPEKYHRNK